MFFSDICCPVCGGELDGVLACCSKCMKEGRRPFIEGASVFAYHAYGKELVLAFKGKSVLSLARVFAAMASERLRENYSHWDFDIIVPVPLHWTRKFYRSFNQSELFAAFLAKELNVPSVPKALRRIKRARSQKFLSGEERHRNLKNAFCAAANIVGGRKILLVDDIFTTGATLSCCSEELLNAGAAKVYVLSIARA